MSVANRLRNRHADRSIDGEFCKPLLLVAADRIEELERLLEDCASIIYKLGDENTYRIHETSPVMAESLDNLEQAIRRIVNP